MIGAGITAFYMTRLFTMTFLGKKRWTDDVHPHESPPVMTIPLILLGIASLASGFLLAWNGAIEKWLEPVVGFQHPRTTDPDPGDQRGDTGTGHPGSRAGLPAVSPRSSADRADVGVAADGCRTQGLVRGCIQ